MTIFYVSKIGDDQHSGISWSDALATISAALSKSTSGDQIWVATGNYSEQIQLEEGVELLGGFYGTEADVNQRRWSQYLTTIDGGGSGTVVTANATDMLNDTCIDGFVIQNGHKGVACTNGASPLISHNRITKIHQTISTNSSVVTGALYSNGSSPDIVNNLIEGANFTVTTPSFQGQLTAAGILCRNGSPNIINNTVVKTSISATYYTVAYGGGIAILGGSAVVKNNIVALNSMAVQFGANGVHGGGLYASNGTNVDANYNCIYNNSPSAYHNVSEGNESITSDPEFFDTSEQQYQLTKTSPCIGAANVSDYPAGLVCDLQGNARLVNEALDIGAYESQENYPPIVSPASGYSPSVVIMSTGPDSYLTYTLDGTTPTSQDTVYYAPLYPTNSVTIKSVSITGDQVSSVVSTPLASRNRTFYVSPSGSNGSSGSSWGNAFMTLDYALLQVEAGDDVWVQAGTYPNSLTMVPGVRLLGGFVGNESSENQRNWVENVTQIQGSGTVITFPEGAMSDSSIDGFTITGGTHGIKCDSGSAPYIVHNIITGNHGSTNTTMNGAVVCNNALPYIANCLIYGNNYSGSYPSTSLYGAGVAVIGGAAFLCNNTIANNKLNNLSNVGSYTRGGGVYAKNANIWLINNIIAANQANAGVPSGGGIYTVGGIVTLKNNCLSGNSPNNIGGGAAGINNISSDPLFISPTSGDYKLQTGSPCIGAGLMNFLPATIDTDLADMSRTTNNSIDMGGYQSQ